MATESSSHCLQLLTRRATCSQDGARENGVRDYLHYWFVESEGNPAKDPVVLWLNGMFAPSKMPMKEQVRVMNQ
jgi:hypothetical protein